MAVKQTNGKVGACTHHNSSLLTLSTEASMLGEVRSLGTLGTLVLLSGLEGEESVIRPAQTEHTASLVSLKKYMFIWNLVHFVCPRSLIPANFTCSRLILSDPASSF